MRWSWSVAAGVVLVAAFVEAVPIGEFSQRQLKLRYGMPMVVSNVFDSSEELPHRIARGGDSEEDMAGWNPGTRRRFKYAKSKSYMRFGRR